MRFVASEWFVKTDYERGVYLQLLGDALRTSDWKCIAYAVMSNHIHLGMVAGRTQRASWLREAHSPFAAWINERLDRIGSVFVKKHGTSAVHPDDVAKVLAYIHNNPVRARIVSRATDSSWTSHNAYRGLQQAPPWLNVALGYELMDIEDPKAFDEFVNAEAARPRNTRRKRGRPRRIFSATVGSPAGGDAAAIAAAGTVGRERLLDAVVRAADAECVVRDAV